MKDKKVLNKYLKNSILTATPEKLILMLYNGCIKNINMAKKSNDENNIEETNNYILKAQKIIYELQGSLDHSRKISKEMNKMYSIIINTLIEANIEKDNERLDIALRFVTEFRDTWAQVIKINQDNIKVSKFG